MDVAIGDADLQAPVADRGERRPARHDRDLRAALRQAGRKMPADGARAVDADPHGPASA